jgi:hypothetical protein
VGTTCYLVNRSPSSTLDDKTPHEVWSGKKPSLQNLRVFGCDDYVHVPKENRSKLDKKAEKCIFIGYKDGVKGYKLWNLMQEHLSMPTSQPRQRTLIHVLKRRRSLILNLY